MILAAGFGTRMRWHADAPPKPLHMLDGRSLIMRMLDRLVAVRCTRIVINIHFAADAIRAHLADWSSVQNGVNRDSNTGAELIFSDEPDIPLETGGGVKAALDLLRGTHFVVANCDSFWLGGKTAISTLVAEFTPSTMDLRLLLARGGTDFSLAPTGQIARGDGFTFAGVQVLDRTLFSDTPHGAFSLNRLYDRAIARTRAYGVILDAQWFHVGTPEALRTAHDASRQFSALNQ